MAEFRVGEIALIHRPGSPYHGTEVTIIEGLHSYYPCGADGRISSDRVDGYTIAGAGLPPYTAPLGKGWAIDPANLRKRRPPPDWVKLCNLTDLPREVTCV